MEYAIKRIILLELGAAKVLGREETKAFERWDTSWWQ
jgi:hypothetical protein